MHGTLEKIALDIKAPYSPLVSLDLSYNLFKMIPIDLLKLKTLECFHMCYNELDAIPYQFHALSNLKCLNLTGNNIGLIPVSIRKIPSLRLSLDFNPLKSHCKHSIDLMGLKCLDPKNNTKDFIVEWQSNY
jgi:hypothetical protein